MLNAHPSAPLSKAQRKTKKSTRPKQKRAITPALPDDLKALHDACERDLERFAREFFPVHCRVPAFSLLHQGLFRRRLAKIAVPLERRRGIVDVVLAPRGSAKSTLVSLVFPAHALLYGLERYILIISATERQARRRLAALRSALLSSERLKACFPERLKEIARNSAGTLEIGGVRIDASSAGSELRGLAHDAWRPTWIILDDVERAERMLAARNRDSLADWFAETVDNLGDRCTNIDLVGTLLHCDALPVRLGSRPEVSQTSYRSILSEAENAGLWDRWRGIMNDLANSTRARDAEAFFERHREAMLAGSRVLWPGKESYYDLQAMRVSIGRRAFDKERQNEPWADGTATFAGKPLRRFRLAGGRIVCDPPFASEGLISPIDGGRPELNLEDLDFYGFLDPAMGTARGDFAAIATVGIDHDGNCYVLDVWLERTGPTGQIQRLLDLHERWDYRLVGVESNCFQGLLLETIAQERERRRRQGRRWQMAAVPKNTRADKSSRILSLEPLLAAGWVLLNEDLGREFMNQLLEYPTARHDDGPDALAAAVQLARGSRDSAEKIKVVPRQERW